jgi:DNA-binding MarR family transcriptional regulator
MSNTIVIDSRRLRDAIRPKSMLELWPQAQEIVQVIASAPGITARQLCNYFGWKRNTRRKMLKRLVEEGYLVTKTITTAGRNGNKNRARAYWVRRNRVRM